MTAKELEGLMQLNELSLSDKEGADMLSLFEDMKKSEDVLTAIDTENVEVMVHVMPMTNVFREDARKQNFSRESLLAGAPEHTEDSWQVPRLVK
ncbi:MAG: Asp-tRNA(Asn)/Glu-tRNA(Gln) amidotransferase subunit GatC [Clostridia bacterium]|nr:Asp-tRNA(Asn)/Glu-tRNA(Gln) amidotransferase subunit GatC [Clostridia bacterium]